MKTGFYPKLAWEGIRKNKQLYTPYLVTCVAMVMMYYIVTFLSTSSAVSYIPGSATICSMLGMGSGVIGVFSLLFLFYSNSFLMRRRKREFGLYNILGMGKRNISKILFWEVLIVAGIALGGGLGLGIALSKLFELALVNMMQGEVQFAFAVSFESIGSTVLVFCGIFGLLFLDALCQISLSKPVELLRSESVGEKPPRANWLAGILGVAILAGAYYLALSVNDAFRAFTVFFVAVIMVIAGTYLLLMAGSVALCRLLQKNKRYFYQANHFVSVSSMAYRMKRNGAGLASICILLTMVLVMLSSTAALYVGAEDFIGIRYPKDINLYVDAENLEDLREENIAPIRNDVQKVLDARGETPEEIYDYRVAVTSGYLADGVVYNDATAFAKFQSGDQSNLVLAYFVSLSDYNQLMGENRELEEGEVLIYPFRTEYTLPTFQVSGGETYQVQEVVDSFVANGDSAMTIFPTVFVFVPDLEETAHSLKALANFSGDSILDFCWCYDFDLDLSAEEQMDVYHELSDAGISDYADIECREAERADFYGLFGGLFFLGIILSIVFLAAAVLIIYYKQISEGYEDQGRFEIMQKVGMTARDIRKTINSQMLTVFFLPLGMAGVHLCFAFPMIQNLLSLFNLWNTRLLVVTSAGCFLIFGMFYAIVYRLTSNRYFAIVSGGKK